MRRTIWIAMLLSAVSCSDSPTVVDISNVYATQSPANALAYYVEWRTKPESPSRLTVDCGPDYQHEFDDTAVRADHRVFVMGLWDGASCDLTIEATLEDSVSDPYTAQIEGGPLPAYMPEITLHTRDAASIQPGWTLTNLSNRITHEPLNVVLVDDQGRYRWYDELNVNFEGGDTDVRTVSTGILVGGLHQLMHPTIIDWQGNEVWSEPDIAMHHDIRPDGDDEDRLLFLSTTNACGNGLYSNTVNLWDRPTRTKVWEWKSCEHFPPAVQGQDWDHLNTVVPMPGGDKLLVSSRNLNRIFQIDRATGDIDWELGAGLDWTLLPVGWFYHQHAPELEPNGDILMFDNGMAGVREYSRALEISYDVNSKTAQIVWQFAPDPPIFAEIWGDADRLPNGNTLVNFGRRNVGEDSHLYEVAPDATPVWHISFAEGWGTYRAERIVDPPVGEVLPDSAAGG